MSNSKAQDDSRGVKHRQVPVAWEALEDAFENNAPEVHSYLHLHTGEVIRIVDGIADPEMHQRILSDPEYLRVDPVSSREQYRWMEHFIASVEDAELRDKLARSIDGKGAFRRFKDVLMSYPVERERWFAFRSDRLRACMEAWLQAHGIEAVPREEWRVPSPDEVKASPVAEDRAPKRARAPSTEQMRAKLRDFAGVLSGRDLDAVVAFAEFLRDRRRGSRARAKGGTAPQKPESASSSGDGPSASGDNPARPDDGPPASE